MRHQPPETDINALINQFCAELFQKAYETADDRTQPGSRLRQRSLEHHFKHLCETLLSQRITKKTAEHVMTCFRNHHERTQQTSSYFTADPAAEFNQKIYAIAIHAAALYQCSPFLYLLPDTPFVPNSGMYMNLATPEGWREYVTDYIDEQEGNTSIDKEDTLALEVELITDFFFHHLWGKNHIMPKKQLLNTSEEASTALWTEQKSAFELRRKKQSESADEAVERVDLSDEIKARFFSQDMDMTLVQIAGIEQEIQEKQRASLSLKGELEKIAHEYLHNSIGGENGTDDEAGTGAEIARDRFLATWEHTFQDSFLVAQQWSENPLFSDPSTDEEDIKRLVKFADLPAFIDQELNPENHRCAEIKANNIQNYLKRFGETLDQHFAVPEQRINEALIEQRRSELSELKKGFVTEATEEYSDPCWRNKYSTDPLLLDPSAIEGENGISLDALLDQLSQKHINSQTLRGWLNRRNLHNTITNRGKADQDIIKIIQETPQNLLILLSDNSRPISALALSTHQGNLISELTDPDTSEIHQAILLELLAHRAVMGNINDIIDTIFSVPPRVKDTYIKSALPLLAEFTTTASHVASILNILANDADRVTYLERVLDNLVKMGIPAVEFKQIIDLAPQAYRNALGRAWSSCIIQNDIDDITHIIDGLCRCDSTDYCIDFISSVIQPPKSTTSQQSYLASILGTEPAAKLIEITKTVDHFIRLARLFDAETQHWYLNTVKEHVVNLASDPASTAQNIDDVIACLDLLTAHPNQKDEFIRATLDCSDILDLLTESSLSQTWAAFSTHLNNHQKWYILLTMSTNDSISQESINDELQQCASDIADATAVVDMKNYLNNDGYWQHFCKLIQHQFKGMATCDSEFFKLISVLPAIIKCDLYQQVKSNFTKWDITQESLIQLHRHLKEEDFLDFFTSHESKIIALTQSDEAVKQHLDLIPDAPARLRFFTQLGETGVKATREFYQNQASFFSRQTNAIFGTPPKLNDATAVIDTLSKRSADPTSAQGASHATLAHFRLLR